MTAAQSIVVRPAAAKEVASVIVRLCEALWAARVQLTDATRLCEIVQLGQEQVGIAIRFSADKAEAKVNVYLVLEASEKPITDGFVGALMDMVQGIVFIDDRLTVELPLQRKSQ